MSGCLFGIGWVEVMGGLHTRTEAQDGSRLTARVWGSVRVRVGVRVSVRIRVRVRVMVSVDV